MYTMPPLDVTFVLCAPKQMMISGSRDVHVCGPGDRSITDAAPVGALDLRSNATCCTSKRTTTEQTRGGSPQSVRTDTGGLLWAAEMEHDPPSWSPVAPAASHVSVRSPSTLPFPAVSRESQDQENSDFKLLEKKLFVAPLGTFSIKKNKPTNKKQD